MLRWENKLESSIFLFAFVFGVWVFEVWMIPLVLTVMLAKEATTKAVSGNWETKIEELFDMPTEVHIFLCLPLKGKDKDKTKNFWLRRCDE